MIGSSAGPRIHGAGRPDSRPATIEWLSTDRWTDPTWVCPGAVAALARGNDAGVGVGVRLGGVSTRLAAFRGSVAPVGVAREEGRAQGFVSTEPNPGLPGKGLALSWATDDISVVGSMARETAGILGWEASKEAGPTSETSRERTWSAALMRGFSTGLPSSDQSVRRCKAGPGWDGEPEEPRSAANEALAAVDARGGAESSAVRATTGGIVERGVAAPLSGARPTSGAGLLVPRFTTAGAAVIPRETKGRPTDSPPGAVALNAER